MSSMQVYTFEDINRAFVLLCFVILIVDYDNDSTRDLRAILVFSYSRLHCKVIC
jgi:hypothetical protein